MRTGTVHGMGALQPWHVLTLLICLAVPAGLIAGVVLLVRRRR